MAEGIKPISKIRSLPLSRFASFLVVALLIAPPKTAAAAGAEGGQEASLSISAQLADIEAKVREGKEALTALDAKRTTLLRAMKIQARAVRDARIRHQALAAELDTLRVQRHTAELRREATAREIAEVRHLAEARLRSLYMTTKEAFSARVLSLFALDDEQRATRGLYYLVRLQEADRALMRRYADLLAREEKNVAEITRLHDEGTRLEEDLAYQAASLDQLIEAERRMLADVEVERRDTRASLARLRDEAIRLERIVAAMTGGATRRMVEQPASTVPFGPGQVALPVVGRIVHGYGRRQVRGFDDYVFSKGVEFAVASGGPVVAVYDGVVRFVGVMPGYDLVIVVDHGARTYSLYGRLGQAKVQVGESVSKGAPIGSVPPLSGGGRNFYFELRIGGRPADPMAFFDVPSLAAG